jgi:hypothetical protein
VAAGDLKDNFGLLPIMAEKMASISRSRKMNLRRFHLAAAAAAIGLAALVGFSNQARAGAYAFSLTEVSNFSLFCADAAGCPTGAGTISQNSTLTTATFSTLNFFNTQSSTALLDGVPSAGVPSNPGDGVIQQACLGSCPAAVTTSPFQFFGAVPPPANVPAPPGTFVDVANQLTGAIVSGPFTPPGGQPITLVAPASANTVAQAQLVGNHVAGLSASQITLSAGFVFTLAGNGTETIGMKFSALEQLIAALDPQGFAATASAKYQITITCAETTDCNPGDGVILPGAVVFDWTPDGTATITGGNVSSAGCNLQNSRNENFVNQTTSLTTPLCDFQATVTLFEGVQYNFTITQHNDISAASIAAVPEPKSLALLAAGLLAIGFTVRRRRQGV